jgi:Ca-activated chloride channel family protein
MERGKNCSFTVRFSPTAQGSFSSKILIKSTDYDQPEQTVALYGVGYGLNVLINKVVSASCSSVVVDVTVTNPNGSLGILEKDNFTVTQNGGTQIITGFTTTDPDSVSEVMVLDFSSRLTSALSNIRDDAKYFVDQLSDADEAAIYKFKDDIIFYPTSSLVTTDATGKTDLKNYITLGPDPVTDGAALYDTVYDSITRAYNGTKSKKAVIVFSDGVNQKTTGKTLAEVIAYAQTLKIPIFTIYYVDPAHAPDAKPEIMKQMAEETGGRDYYADTTTIDIIFGQISALLSKKYTITYAPTSCPVSALLKVEALSGGLTGLDTETIVFP